MAKIANLTVAYYSKTTGKRVSERYGSRNYDKCNVYEIDVPWARKHQGKKDFVLDADGIPSNVFAAEYVRAAYNTHLAKLEARRAAAKVKKAAEAVKQVGKKTAKKVAKKRTIDKSAVTGKIVSKAEAAANPDTTYQSKVGRGQSVPVVIIDDPYFRPPAKKNSKKSLSK